MRHNLPRIVRVLLLSYTEKKNRVHLFIFQHDNPCSDGNFLTRLTVSRPLIALILFSFNTDSRVNEHAQVSRCLQRAWSKSKLHCLEDKLFYLMGNWIGLKYWTRLHIAQHDYLCSWTRLIFSVYFNFLKNDWV